MKDIIEETIRLIVDEEELEYELDKLCEMANITKKHTQLSLDIWSEHKGVERNKKDKLPRVKVGNKDFQVSITIEKNPKVLATSKHLKQSELNQIQQAKEYIGSNYDLFLKHYNDIHDEFEDIDLVQALKERGVYK